MPVSTPHIVCGHCGKPTSLWMPLCTACAGGADELPPVIGERFRDVLDERARHHQENH